MNEKDHRSLRPINGGKPVRTKVEYLPPIFVELNKELRHHPELRLALQDAEVREDLGLSIGVIAAYVGIVLDGVYSPSEIEILLGILIGKLQQKRTIVILP